MSHLVDRFQVLARFGKAAIQNHGTSEGFQSLFARYSGMRRQCQAETREVIVGIQFQAIV